MTEDVNMDNNPVSGVSARSFIKELIDKVFKGDKVIWLVFVILCVISMVEIFSATSTIVYQKQNHWGPIMRHAMFLIAGFGLIIFMHNVSFRFYSSLIFLLGLSIILLLLTPFLGETINGAERWIRILGFTIQPSEFAKLSLMGTIAFMLSKQNEKNEKVLFKWMIGVTAFVALIIAKDNLSTALLLSFVIFLMMFIGNVKIRRLLLVVAIAAVGIVLLIGVAKIAPKPVVEHISLLKRSETWGGRVFDFMNHDELADSEKYSVNDDNFQSAHAKIAIANGGVFGRFPGNSVARDFLPQAYSDFIYAIILEELGFFGGIFVFMLYVIILIRAGMIARKSDSLFAKYLVLGSALMLSIQAFMNMAVAVGAIPVTGQPLPLISRGGTSTLVTCAYFGIILSADRFGVGRKNNDPEGDEDEGVNEEPEAELITEPVDSGESKVDAVDYTVIQV